MCIRKREFSGICTGAVTQVWNVADGHDLNDCGEYICDEIKHNKAGPHDIAGSLPCQTTY